MKAGLSVIIFIVIEIFFLWMYGLDPNASISVMTALSIIITLLIMILINQLELLRYVRQDRNRARRERIQQMNARAVAGPAEEELQ
ncbi:hypothetical protein [Paenibacillus aquistagni]|uniref:hypothetical protein n=1 Tax=Paenibacillus aquistagni TaxID=1852522 RepID=UPI00145B1323|nr:hypothetical protein [Paenibacillus aquistagni]NMM53905.1 hypothetical protein [Paenibacillus aquistagni]